MSEETSPAISPTVLAETPMPQATGKKAAPRKRKNSPTENQVQARGHIKQSELVKWTVFVRPEVKIAVQKAAKKAGITDTAWLDSALWETATADLSKKAQPPAKVEDVADLMGQLERRLADQQAEALKAQGDQMQELAAAIKSQPANLKEWLFGKPRQD